MLERTRPSRGGAAGARRSAATSGHDHPLGRVTRRSPVSASLDEHSYLATRRAVLYVVAARARVRTRKKSSRRRRPASLQALPLARRARPIAIALVRLLNSRLATAFDLSLQRAIENESTKGTSELSIASAQRLGANAFECCLEQRPGEGHEEQAMHAADDANGHRNTCPILERHRHEQQQHERQSFQEGHQAEPSQLVHGPDLSAALALQLSSARPGGRCPGGCPILPLVCSGAARGMGQIGAPLQSFSEDSYDAMRPGALWHGYCNHYTQWIARTVREAVAVMASEEDRHAATRYVVASARQPAARSPRTLLRSSADEPGMAFVIVQHCRRTSKSDG